MARILKELIRKPSAISSRFIATFTHQTPACLSPPSLLNQSIFHGQPKFDHGNSNQGLRVDTHLSRLQIYPSFSFGYFLDPCLAFGLDGSQVVGLGQERDGMLWADSVKKKRKKKMNKHKYKKLRKRLRRKTKT